MPTATVTKAPSTFGHSRRAESALGDTYPLFAAAYGLDGSANFEGRWHLQRAADDASLAEQFALAADTVADRLAAARQTLFEQRATRNRPGRDDKILTSWERPDDRRPVHRSRCAGPPRLRDRR